MSKNQPSLQSFCAVVCQVELGRALRRSQNLERENSLLRGGDAGTELVAESTTMREVLEVIERVRPRRAYLTHMSHDLDHGPTESALPPGVSLAYDGLTLPF